MVVEVSYTHAFSKFLQNKTTNTNLSFLSFIDDINQQYYDKRCMHYTIIKSCIITETSNNLVHSYVSTSKHTKVNTIVSTKSTDNTLQLTRVKGPMFTHDIHITFQHIVRRSTERVEKFTDNSILVYVSVFTRFLGRLRVTH